jgi:hypothetical protein
VVNTLTPQHTTPLVGLNAAIEGHLLEGQREEEVQVLALGDLLEGEGTGLLGERECVRGGGSIILGRGPVDHVCWCV